jgi:hypothetical protein
VTIIPDEIGAVLVLWQQQLLLCLDSFDLPEIPPERIRKIYTYFLGKRVSWQT